MLLYVTVTRARPETVAYLITHGLKIVGGAGGGHRDRQKLILNHIACGTEVDRAESVIQLRFPG